ncbi:Subunit of heteropentameric Replication factor C (RF-C) [Lithohypha guttulata]|uniref:Subunit of heteropentameric Replication factor C (RF-C) n=1 Tax=Lithohypha guttulata TaxID=1690604 RepID=A0AAN7T1U8_9EURO|nr:Subunit of heteropentameric Replication factor C (RF-C) [Lithohypha guttulata]KAK5087982.1 Subunit of heteropentameric Replication factor C (RF-C) [Lithohypha guttulata]KAK5101349.1 Subunit of heteropentameric Replication factor C (RF-C) [Lithohypha guttulata]
MASFFDNKARAKLAAEKGSSSTKPGVETTVAPRMQPWVEKYRPKTLEDVKSQDHVVDVLRRMLNSASLPHLLMYGPPGTGKTSTILALSRELFGPELFSSRVLELNASDERGITVVRERIKVFAQQALMHAPASKEYREKYPCPPFKIIILDEADSLTQDSQSALRRVMENYAAVTRIAFCCNYVTRIIDPIASRCSKFRFKALSGGASHGRIAEILKAENVAYEDGVVELTLKLADGDLRKALQLLQSAARLVGATATVQNGQSNKKSKKSKIVDDEDEEMVDVDSDKPPPRTITPAILNEIAGVVPPQVVDDLVSVMMKGATQNYKRISTAVDDLVASGWAATEVLSSLYQKLIYDDLISSQKKCKILPILSLMDKRLLDGSEETLSILDMVCQISKVLAAK